MTVNTRSESAPVQRPTRGRQRLSDIDRAKGLMMILVVLGHISDPAGPPWANMVRALIYGFHMPVFMYLSGFIFVYTSSHLIKPQFGRYILNRANRLLVPFVIMAFIIVNLKVLSETFTAVNRPVSSILSAYGSIFIGTNGSPALSIWYLFVLFEFSVLTPPLYRLFQQWFLPLVLLALAMYAWFVYDVSYGGLTDDFYVSRMCWFYIFFIYGCMACKYSELWLTFVRRWWPFLLIIFALLDYLLLDTEWRYLLVGLVGAPAIHGLMGSKVVSGDKALSFVGSYAMSIYLFNTVFLGIARVGFARFAVPSGHMALLYIVSFPLGLFGPMSARWLLARILPSRIIYTYLV